MISLEDYAFQYGNHKIVLRPFVLEPTPENPDLLGAQFRVDVIESLNFPSEVFIWEVYQSNDAQGRPVTYRRPVCVAKPGDLGTYPVDNPDPYHHNLPPFYRKPWFEMTFAAPDLLIETWDDIKIDVGQLVKSVIDLGGP